MSGMSTSTAGQGGSLAGWLLQRLRGGFTRASAERRMHVVETLSLGGKRQLMLVVCDGERFLIGVGAESVSSLTALGNESSL
jgi:flagellar biogenesis protein FliO